MSESTEIEYADSTGNLQMGCEGCELWNPKNGVKKCYAGRITSRYAGGKKGWPTAFEKPMIFPERLKGIVGMSNLAHTERANKPWLNGYPRIVFLNDMGDQHSAGLPFDWLSKFIPELEASPHIYLMLTKRPSTAVKFWQKRGNIPANFWVGTSVTNPTTKKRAEILSALEGMASVLWLSVEPYMKPMTLEDDILRKFKWVVTGGDSDTTDTAFSHPLWYERLRQHCEGLGVRFFFKQWGCVAPADLVAHPPESRFAMHEDGRISQDWQSVSGEVGWAIMARVPQTGAKAPAKLGGLEYHEMPPIQPHGQLDLLGGLQ